MSLIRGDQQQQYQQPMQGQIPQQPLMQRPPTLFERAMKREKWVVVWSALSFLIGIFEVIAGRSTMGWAFGNFALNLIGLSALNFVVVPWVQNTFYKSKESTQNFFNQRYK